MIRKILLCILLLPFIVVALLYTTGNGFFINAVERTYLQGHATANINDADAFELALIESKESKEVEGTGAAQTIANAKSYNTRMLDPTFAAELEKWGSVAYLVMKDGEVISEHYFNGYNNRSRTNSFSMAKTVLTMMVGIAIEEGVIKSLNQPVSDFIPEFANDPLGKSATLANLSLMNSGYDWVEDYYSWFSPTVELYHGSDVETFLVNRSFSHAPGERWYYSSASTQLLGIALKRALIMSGREISLSAYLSEKIWQPLGMNDDASWHTDNKGMEMVFCCINTNARNFAKLGQLMLNNGQWNGQQIVPAEFVKKMIQPDGAQNYGYSTWLNYQNDPPFYNFSGHLGQSISVVPEHQLVVVRLGEERNTQKNFQTESLAEYVAEALRLINE